MRSSTAAPATPTRPSPSGQAVTRDYAWVEVIDQDGAWASDAHDDEHGRGLIS